MSEWQPIDTYPIVGDMVLLSGFICDQPKAGRWVAVGEFINGEWIDPDNSPLYPPTHWMQLPEPPKGD